MTASCVLDPERKNFLFSSKWWHPHFMKGFVVLGDNPTKTGWLAWGNFKCWSFLCPVYKFMILRVFGMHVVEMASVVKAMNVSISDPKLFGDWTRELDLNFKGVAQ